MDKLVLDDQAASVLGAAKKRAELVNSSGHVLGYFVPPAGAPVGASDSAIYDWLRAQISEEELDRRSREPLGRTTDEVLRRLGA